ncbi:MAG: YezD family protein [Clostridiales Family XIII bacterium]|nr:YezD family protein [Clostridiales Family XIII bacterium]
MRQSKNMSDEDLAKEIARLRGSSISEEQLGLFFEYLSQIRYGSITLTIQDGKAIQIDKIEKIRIR